MWLIVPVKIASNQRFYAGGVVSWFGVVFWQRYSRPPLNGSVGRLAVVRIWFCIVDGRLLMRFLK